MNLNLLAISIGNTRTRLGTFLDGKLAATQTLNNQLSDKDWADRLKEAHAPLADTDDSLTIMASVNPPVAERLTAILSHPLGLTPNRVEQDLAIPIGRQLDRECLVGDDRLLNAAAAYDVLKQACVIVDAGTAVTVDYVDGAGTFHGGAIAPGAGMMLASLHEHTAQLPEVTLAKPEEPIGHNTAEAMRTAAYHGIRGMVRELVEQYATVAGSYPIVIATGGDAELLFKDDEFFDRIAPDLTVMGIVLTAKTAQQSGV